VRKLIYLAVLIALVYVSAERIDFGTTPWSSSASASEYIASAYRERLSNVQVSGAGAVVRLFADDTRGSRHQRFILRLDEGTTLLIAHNIDLAPRLETIAIGDIVEFRGEYEWNDRGGVLHWTHHDPQGVHDGGWLKHNGRTYQ
jgi:Protein of unknown function (DUF3465)